MVKRIFDFLVSTSVLVLLAPLMLLLAIVILIDSGRPVLYKQIRIGRHGENFQILKFRTMVNGVDRHGDLTIDDDPRITRVGRFLRRSKFDELPQLVNVACGQMSLVGPRPELPKFVDCYSAEDKNIILSVRPGITDNASIEFRNESALFIGVQDAEGFYIEQILPVKLLLYREYVKNNSFAGDIRIISNTIRSIW